MKKLRISQEFAYILATILISFGVAMSAQADLGMSMIVAPAYILSLRFEALSFGQAEYIVQALVFLLFCLVVRRFKPIRLCSFLSGILYGAVLDLVRAVIPALNPSVYPAGSFSMPARIALFVAAALITALSIALYFRAYFYPQVYDYVVRELSERSGMTVAKFKTLYDLSYLTVAVVLSLAFFGALRGVGIGTVALALVNGSVIGFFGGVLDRYVEFYPRFPRLAERFE